MPNPRFRRVSHTGRRTRRRVNWADFAFDGTVGVGNFVSLDLLDQFVAVTGASRTGSTVARIHGRTWITSAVTEGDGLSDALIVDQLDEVEAPPGIATSSPHVLSPTFSPNADWMLYRQWNAHPSYGFGGLANQWETDVRSRRRLHEIGDTLLYVIENRDATATVSFACHFRVLLMMP